MSATAADNAVADANAGDDDDNDDDDAKGDDNGEAKRLVMMDILL